MDNQFASAAREIVQTCTHVIHATMVSKWDTINTDPAGHKIQQGRAAYSSAVYYRVVIMVDGIPIVFHYCSNADEPGITPVTATKEGKEEALYAEAVYKTHGIIYTP